MFVPGGPKLRSRRRLGALLVTAMLVGIAGSAVATVEVDLSSPLKVRVVDRPAYDTKTITVKFREGIRLERAADVVADLGCSVDRPSLYTPGLSQIAIPDGEDIAKWIEIFGRRLDVQYAEPTYYDYIAFTPNDPSYSSQWNFTMIGMSNAWDKVPSRGSTSIKVAVLDSGVAYENYGTAPNDYIIADDLVGVNFVNPKDIINSDNHPNDDNHHGTHVCGTIAQKTNNSEGVAGMADGVSIMPVKSLDWCGSGTHQNFSDGVHWAVDNGAKIINYSAGGSHSTQKHDAVKYAYNNGVLLIAAMGNNNQQDSLYAYPGAYDEAMGVGAVAPDKTRAYYSNYGTGIDVVAPGGEQGPTADGVLQHTFYAGPDDPGTGCPNPVPQPKTMGYYYFQGTSMATPHVSGLAALLWTEGTYNTRATVKTRIQNKCEDLGTTGYDTTFGHGLIKAGATIPTPSGPPVLSWAGVPGYTNDGVDPNSGDPAGTAGEDRFWFKVKYTDSDGDAPLKAQCIIQRRLCNGTWTRAKVLTLSPVKLGTYKTGKIFQSSVKLPNEVLKYKFYFTAADGTATGAPTKYTQGPLMRGAPKLCWIGGKEYNDDGVHPNSGPLTTRFSFKVKYMDSWGSPPVKANLQIRRYKNIIQTVAMVKGRGSYRMGVPYRASIKLRRGGLYSYRFQFADGTAAANGDPAKWKAGPTITKTVVAATVGALSATPTNAGAQLTFTLSSDAAVTATVMNVAGRPVRTIARGKELEAGMNTLVWDRRSDTGLAVPAGLYMIRVEAKLEDGQSSSAMAAMTLR